jgi:uncharacterized protein YhdP
MNNGEGRSPWTIALRAGLVLATLVSCVIAGLQLSGRLLLGFADALTPRANLLLQPYGIELDGVSGNWRGFNPVVLVKHVRFAAGEMREVEVELDFFRSLMGDDLIFAHAQVLNGRVGFVHTSAGWQFKGSLDRTLNIDFVSFAQNTRSADIDMRVIFERGAVASDYDVVLKIDNDNLNARAVASIVNAKAASQTRSFTMSLATHHAAGVADSPGRVAHTQFNVYGNLLIEPGLLSPAGLALSVSEGSWVEHQGNVAGILGTGRLSAEISVLESPLIKAGAVPTLVTSVDFQRLGEKFFGQLQGNLSAGNREPQPLPNMSFEVSADEVMSALGIATSFSDMFIPEDLLAKAVVENIELEQITMFANDILQPETILGDWIAGLNVRGQLDHLVAYYDEQLGFGFAAEAKQLKLSAHRGSPSFSNMSADIFGDLQHIGMRVSGQNVTMEFPNVFADAWFFEQVQGQLMLLFRQGYGSVRGHNIEAYSGISRIKGGFATSRPSARDEQRLSVGLAIDRIQIEKTGPYVPQNLSDGLRQWLDQAPQRGELSDAQIAHHGQIHLLPGNRSRRRFEMTANFQHALVKFAEDWPALAEGAGNVHISGSTAYGIVDQGRVGGFDLAGAKVRVESSQAMVFLDLMSKATGSELLNLIRATPLQQSLGFVSPQWVAEGDINFTAKVAVPLGKTLTRESGLAVDLTTSFSDLALDLPEYRLAWRNLSGQHTFSLPHNVQGEMSGELFGEPVRIDITHDPQNLRFGFEGQFDADDILFLADIPPNPIVTGSDYLQGELTLAMDGVGKSQLRVATDLRGFGIDLPAEFGKPLGVLEPSEFVLTFGVDSQEFDWLYGSTQGRLLLPVEGAVRGSVGVGAKPADVVADYEGFVVSGNIDRIDLADWVSADGAPAVKTPFSWQIRELDVGELVIDELTFTDVFLNAESTADSLALQLEGQDIAGSVDLSDPAIAQIDLLKLRLPALPTDGESFSGNLDPVDLSTGYALPRAAVFVDRLYLGEKAFGRWKFDIIPEQDAVRFAVDDIAVNGVRLTDSILRWDLSQNVSAFSGSVDVEDLAKTLPLWGYAPMAKTTTASVNGNLSWAGSPANFDFVVSEGNLSLAATEGRFLDIESQGAGLRAVSLLNITALTKRISFDFSDVIGEGISFEKVSGVIQLEDRNLTFIENLMIESTSSRYEIGGTVDLRNDQLDAQMIITLPVSDSLPWYAAYLAFVNPVAGISLAVGERVFRKPIERMSSAKFAVSGGLDDPNVVFTELFNRDIAVADARGERLSPDLNKNRDAEADGDQTR